MNLLTILSATVVAQSATGVQYKLLLKGFTSSHNAERSNKTLICVYV